MRPRADDDDDERKRRAYDVVPPSDGGDDNDEDDDERMSDDDGDRGGCRSAARPRHCYRRDDDVRDGDGGDYDGDDGGTIASRYYVAWTHHQHNQNQTEQHRLRERSAWNSISRRASPFAQKNN